MKAFERTPAGLSAEFEEFEVSLLASLVDQVVEVMGGREAVRDVDPLEKLFNGFPDADRPELDRTDPVVQRLFPDAYPDDPEAAAEFRRFTDEEAIRGRVADADIVLADLDTINEERLVIPDDHVGPWIKTLNAVRLAMAARLGIVDERSQRKLSRLPSRDPRRNLMHLYEWLGYVLETLLEAVHS
ncbi:DUF2017 domain-containing protein [Nigerium massiliense]|uniref:DUF2017 domain-containing protein n=1 Tax=Nigerium massiliense TaxID=1522317 RepID=UPI00058C091B|nr:DUF2017 domain-containing protein [Nigerium massiliense]